MITSKNSGTVRTISSLLLLATLFLTSSKTFAQDLTSSSSETVEIPASDWTLCKRYKATLEKRVEDLKTCTSEGIDVRRSKNECVGELSGAKTNFSECRTEKLEIYSALALTRAELERRKSPFFWISVGTLGASLVWLALELTAPDPGELPHLPRTLTAGAIATGSVGMLIFSW